MLVITMFSFGGCSNKPADFPDTVPFTLIITKNNAPLEDASVVLHCDTGVNYAVGGMTDAKGVVAMTTVCGSYRRSGTPVGTFKVTVEKEPVVPGALPQEEVNKLDPDESTLYYQKLEKARKATPPALPVKYATAGSTPLSVTVASGASATLAVD